jgi:hypothetical protein
VAEVKKIFQEMQLEENKSFLEKIKSKKLDT